jgi:hypothetical protein
LGTAPTTSGGLGGALGSIASALFHPTPTVNAASALAWAGPAFAAGTEDAPGGVALVGEKGPELVAMPAHAAVYTASRTRSMLGGGANVVNNFNFVDESGAPVAGAVASQKRNGSGGIDATIVIKGVMKSALADGSMDQVMNAAYGVKRAGR